MNKQNCQIFETYNSVSDLKRDTKDGRIRLSGVFGVCGKRNNNQRVYDKKNYQAMIKEMKERIAKEGGVAGTLEHENTMYVTLENVSHKVTDIDIDKDGVVTGTIELLNTPKGQIAQAIVEGGLPLFISSRATGNVDKFGNVTLEKLATYDIVSAPGFSEARLHLNESQIMESLGDNCVVVLNKEANESGSVNEGDTNDNHTMNNIEQLENKISELEEKIETLTESLEAYKDLELNIKKWCATDFADKIQDWLLEEYQPEINENLKDEVVDEVKENTSEDLKSEFLSEAKENFNKVIVETLAPAIQQWIVEEYSPELQNWLINEYSPEVQNWLVNEYAPKIQQWIVEKYSNVVERWVKEEYSESVKDQMTETLEDNKKNKLNSIKETLELLESVKEQKPRLGHMITESNIDEPLYIQNMPMQYRPKYNLCSAEVRENIDRRARLYNFNNEGAIERFWAQIDFDKYNAENSQSQKNKVLEGIDSYTDVRERAIREALRRFRNSRNM